MRQDDPPPQREDVRTIAVVVGALAGGLGLFVAVFEVLQLGRKLGQFLVPLDQPERLAGEVERPFHVRGVRSRHTAKPSRQGRCDQSSTHPRSPWWSLRPR